MNVYEINMAIRGLQALEAQMCREWEKAQNAKPFGAMATSIFHELRTLRELADKLQRMSLSAE